MAKRYGGQIRRPALAALSLMSGFLAMGTAWALAEGAGVVPALSQAQVDAGRSAYVAHCAECHGASLEGGGGPALTGPGVVGRWADGTRTAADLFHVVRSTMPLQAPASLSDETYAAISAFLLFRNGYSPGAAPFDPKLAAAGPLASPPTASGQGKARGVAVRPPLLVAPANPLSPTTHRPDDGELRAADPSVWLTYNRDLESTRFSALDQINAGNARRLTAKCLFQTGETGSFQPSPVVYDGYMYITTAYSTYALDPATCVRKWVHTYPDQESTVVSQARGVAIHRGRLFRVTPNGHLIALDAKTGTLLWDVLTSDVSVGHWLSMAPVAYDGLVFMGEAGADWGANGHIHAFDVATGRRAWTFNVIPTGKEHGAETWGKGSEHGGGSLWASLSLDVSKGLLYASIGNPAPDYDGAMRPGDNLFTNSVVALNYRTGKLAWYAQQVPHDVHDWDTGATPTLYSRDGRDFMSVANKAGWAYIYDRRSHKLVAKTEISPQENVDRPITREGTHHCPGITGGAQWNGTAYSPRTGLLYVNSVHWCGTTTLTETRYVAGSAYTGAKHVWDPVETARGFTTAIDSTTGKVAWKREAPTPMVSALTPTAGGVVFTGGLDGNFLVLDADTGRTLYSFNTGGAIAGAASTYLVDGRQYVAVTSGNASRTVWKTTGAGTVVVFSLPES